jgi:uncharacterized protein YecT (DUF1311 family)
MKIVTAVSLALLGLAAPLVPQTCAGNTAEVVNCLAKDLTKVDGELNVEYKRALKVAREQWTPIDVQNLKDAQRKWIAYRDAVCKAEYGLIGGGTAGPATHISCLIRITRQRIGDLQAEY